MHEIGGSSGSWIKCSPVSLLLGYPIRNRTCVVLILRSWGGVGWDVNVHVKLPIYLMLRHWWGGVGWGGMLTSMWSCPYTWCYTPLMGWGEMGWGWRLKHSEHENLFRLCGTQVAKSWQNKTRKWKTRAAAEISTWHPRSASVGRETEIFEKLVRCEGKRPQKTKTPAGQQILNHSWKQNQC